MSTDQWEDDGRAPVLNGGKVTSPEVEQLRATVDELCEMVREIACGSVHMLGGGVVSAIISRTHALQNNLKAGPVPR